jgi:patched 1 protein
MAHFVHAFMHIEGTRNERAMKAYYEVGSPIFGGAMTTLLCNLLMCFSNTGFVIRYYGYMFIAIVFICMLNGLFLFPVLLSLIGPTNAADNDGPIKIIPIIVKPLDTDEVETPGQVSDKVTNFSS